MTVREIFDFLKQIAPLELAMPYDNPGFLIGDLDAVVTKAIVTLDCTSNVVKTAKSQGAELIITHHPVIYTPLSNVTTEYNRRVFDCLNNGISVISMHTNLDVAEGGVNDCLANALGLKNITNITDEEGFSFRKGELVAAMTPEGLAKYIKSRLGGVVRYIDSGKMIKTVAVCGGSGGSFVDLCIGKADALVTADVKHSMLIDAKEKDFSVFDAGHFHTENVVIEPLTVKLSQKFTSVLFTAFNPNEIKTI